jgi:hypothetical protein
MAMSTDARVFSKAWKRKYSCLAALGPVLCWLALPLLAALIVLAVAAPGHRAEVFLRLFSLALMVGLPLGLVAQYFQPRWGYRQLREALAAKLRERDGVAPEQWGGIVVGWSPGPQTKNWEGDTDCDVGFLFLGPSYLTYLGDLVRFSLRREGVWMLDQSVSSGPWLPGKRILVGHTWPDGYQHFFTLDSRETANMYGRSAANRSLYALLDAWWRGTAQLTTDPPAVSDGPPETGPELPPAKPMASGGGHVLAIFGGVAIGLVFGVIAGVVLRLMAGVSGPITLLIAFFVSLVVGNIAGVVLLRVLPRPEEKS